MDAQDAVFVSFSKQKLYFHLKKNFIHLCTYTQTHSFHSSSSHIISFIHCCCWCVLHNIFATCLCVYFYGSVWRRRRNISYLYIFVPNGLKTDDLSCENTGKYMLRQTLKRVKCDYYYYWKNCNSNISL